MGKVQPQPYATAFWWRAALTTSCDSCASVCRKTDWSHCQAERLADAGWRPLNWRVSATQTWRVGVETRDVRQMSGTGIDLSAKLHLAATTEGYSGRIAGRPPFRPRARAAVTPAFVRSRINRRSHWASTVKMATIRDKGIRVPRSLCKGPCSPRYSALQRFRPGWGVNHGNVDAYKVSRHRRTHLNHLRLHRSRRPSPEFGGAAAMRLRLSAKCSSGGLPT